jgi:glycerol-3-phosphate acyltransferase PlsX
MAAAAAGNVIKAVFTKNPFRMTTGYLNKAAFRELKDYGNPELQGGAPLLGLNGVCIIGHGSSTPLAVKNAIKLAGECIKFGINQKITDKIRIFHETMEQLKNNNSETGKDASQNIQG